MRATDSEPGGSASPMRISRVRDEFESLSTSQLRDAAPARVAVSHWRLIRRGRQERLVGPVFPVQTANDMLPVLQGVQACPPGWILVLENTSEKSEALAGEIVATAAVQQGLGGLVIKGALRDTKEVAASNLPVWSTDVNIVSAKTAAQPAASIPGMWPSGLSPMVNLSFRVGDWLIIDRDAAVTVRDAEISAVFGAARLLAAREGMLLEALRAGRRLDDIVGLDAYLRGEGPLAMEV